MLKDSFLIRTSSPKLSPISELLLKVPDTPRHFLTSQKKVKAKSALHWAKGVFGTASQLSACSSGASSGVPTWITDVPCPFLENFPFNFTCVPSCCRE
ncbi:hypothetical protein TWF730_008465 [Orbilia blumenaviensis]|uniref:Uncharacterized protein n=1 Tax=Orbilia blumenaviensis TaxID=1796055 RepID=A0AAV9V377_9PEZI